MEPEETDIQMYLNFNYCWKIMFWFITFFFLCKAILILFLILIISERLTQKTHIFTVFKHWLILINNHVLTTYLGLEFGLGVVAADSKVTQQS